MIHGEGVVSVAPAGTAPSSDEFQEIGHLIGPIEYDEARQQWNERNQLMPPTPPILSSLYGRPQDPPHPESPPEDVNPSRCTWKLCDKLRSRHYDGFCSRDHREDWFLANGGGDLRAVIVPDLEMIARTARIEWADGIWDVVNEAHP